MKFTCGTEKNQKIDEKMININHGTSFRITLTPWLLRMLMVHSWHSLDQDWSAVWSLASPCEDLRSSSVCGVFSLYISTVEASVSTEDWALFYWIRTIKYYFTVIVTTVSYYRSITRLAAWSYRRVLWSTTLNDWGPLLVLLDFYLDILF